jgi:hypothetical protein
MSERWFSEDELASMARPTMERAIEALDAGDVEGARAACEAMKTEWGMLHDLMTESVLGLVTYIQGQLGDEGVAAAWEQSCEKGWRRHAEAIDSLPRKRVAELLAATWRAHSTSGTGEDPGAFTIHEDEEKLTFELHPCGSGGRLVRRGLYERNGYGKTTEAHDWSFHRKDMPLYCTHCAFMNESLPLKWSGYALYPLDPPEDYATDPCRWYWYKDPADIPERFAKRYGPPASEPAQP